MSANERWLLPDGIDELLPPDSWRMERLRLRVADQFYAWGYELVMPPLVEYLDSLLTGTGEDLDLQTYKIIDQQSGRLMGVRADMTPQIARIQSRLPSDSGITRLCYIGPVLNTQQQALGSSREPLQIGAELFGSGSAEAECELIELMVEVLRTTGVEDIHIDLGHVGIFRAIARQAGMDHQQEVEFFDALHRKSHPDIEQLFTSCDIDPAWKSPILELTRMHGAIDDIEEKTQSVFGLSDEITQAIERVKRVAGLLNKRLSNVKLHYDLAELHGYHYYTGIVFSAFIPNHGRVIARGGRYDDIGKAFGHARPATGFSTDMRRLLQFSSRWKEDENHITRAPQDDDNSLTETIQALRASGDRVVRRLPDEALSKNDKTLTMNDSGEWRTD